MAPASDQQRCQALSILRGEVHRLALGGCVLFSVLWLAVPVMAQDSDRLVDSLRTAVKAVARDSLEAPDSLKHPGDSLADIAGEAVGDSAIRGVVYSFWPPHSVISHERRVYEDRLAGSTPPMPPARVLAAGDLADWLGLFGAYDVADAPGVGQNRFFTHWGVANRQGNWRVEGRPVVWQRLTFPQTAQFDPGILPSFPFATYTVGDRVALDYDTTWSSVAQSSYFYRQGDFADTYSEGKFRRLIGLRLGVDLDFTFFDSDGRFVGDNRDTRQLRLRLVGPLRGDLMWSYRFFQFRDKTLILTPEPFTSLVPRRDDLMWQMAVEVYRSANDQPGWILGFDVQSGKQKIRDASNGYKLDSRDQRWTVWGQRTLAGWHVDGELIWERLEIDSVTPNRWSAYATAGRTWVLPGDWQGVAEIGLSDWDTDPLAPTATIVLGPDSARSGLFPSLRVSRTRTVPSLFDRQRPVADSMASASTLDGFFYYSESGQPGLSSQWENALSLRWESRSASADGDGRGVAYSVEAHTAYIEDYIRWENVSSDPTNVFHSPIAGDVRTAGVALALAVPLGSDFTITGHYAAKYAATLGDTRLAGFYPHKAVAILSWIKPQLRWGIDVQGNVTGIWWYGDRRIDPTRYTEPQVLRVDLSGMARMKSFSFNYLVQNVFNFEYRTQAGFPMTGRTVRFGVEWHFLN